MKTQNRDFNHIYVKYLAAQDTLKTIHLSVAGLDDLSLLLWHSIFEMLTTEYVQKGKNKK